ncbi:PREDICTED: DNA repair protein RAD51 homolog 3-like [Nicrophorus vespilloides]|uniref:DNA repair protein RAD51 homolog 3 n=1 Tax=Nicrophorus vespilloides TaxID=110193 RepID=A0ABM1MLD1_NICVS|nr:PREDICTED: DNA repair protein RAD51 homolog 3-like [Nicrophorus vespilloides]
MYQPLYSIEFNADSKEFNPYQLKYVEDIDEDFIPSGWNKLVEAPKTCTAYDLLTSDNEKKISTTIEGLDFALDGGFSVGQINEFTGKPGSGKTQLCFRICVKFLLSNNETNVLFLSTNHNFASQRIEDLIKSSNEFQNARDELKNMLLVKLMKRIKIFEVQDITDLLASVKYLEYNQDYAQHLGIVFIDSIFIPFKELEQNERTSYIFRFYSNLQRLSTVTKLTVIVTNSITTVFNVPGEFTYFGSSYLHRLNIRIKLERLGQTMFKAKIDKCPYLCKSQSFNFSIV